MRERSTSFLCSKRRSGPGSACSMLISVLYDSSPKRYRACNSTPVAAGLT